MNGSVYRQRDSQWATAFFYGSSLERHSQSCAGGVSRRRAADVRDSRSPARGVTETVVRREAAEMPGPKCGIPRWN
jgi:hypothetical protein